MTLSPIEPHGLRYAPPLPNAVAPPRVRVFVVHNHPVYRVGVVSVLAAEPGVLCVGEAADLAEAVHTAPPLAPDVLLLDRNMPDAADAETLARLRHQLPRLRLVVLASKLDPQAPKSLPVAGACLVLPRGTSAADLVAASAMCTTCPPAWPAHAGVRALAATANSAPTSRGASAICWP